MRVLAGAGVFFCRVPGSRNHSHVNRQNRRCVPNVTVSWNQCRLMSVCPETMAAERVRFTSKVYSQSVTDDYPHGLKTTVKGSIPRWLKGSFLRTGPGRYEIGKQRYKHMFDGLALLHRFNFEDGSVTYQSRFLDSKAYQKAMKENRIVMTEFGTAGFPDPCLNIFSRAMSTFLTRLKFTDNCNVNFMRSGDEFYALTETPMIQKIDPKSLEKQETIDISKIISVFTGTAHPHQTEDGTIYNLGLNFHLRSTYNIVEIPPPNQAGVENGSKGPLRNASVALSVPCTETYPSYSHSFFMTPNYIVLVEQPLYINMLKLASLAVMGLSFADVLEFHPEKPTRFHVVRRSDHQRLSTKYVTEALFFFHQINAFESHGHLVLDMCGYKDDTIIRKLYLKEIEQDGLAEVEVACKRFVLPLDTEGYKPEAVITPLPNCKASTVLQKDGSVFCAPAVLGDVGLELPRINYEKFSGQPYRYVYGSVISEEKDNMLGKMDVETGTTVTWEEDSCIPSEPVFVRNPEGKAEDDGIVLSSVINFNEGGLPYLLVLDAKTFTEIGRAEIPVKKMPFGIHGVYFPNV